MSSQAGPLLISTWINAVLYAFVIGLSYRYFKHFREDRAIFKILVLACLLLDTACTAIEFAGVYEYTIIHWGDAAYMKSPNRTTTGYIFCTGVTAFLVQVYLIYRFTTITRKRLAASLLLILTLITFAASIGAGIVGLSARSWLSRSGSEQIPTAAWIITTAVTDLGISGALIYALVTARKETGMKFGLFSNVISTGSLPALNALVALVVYFAVSSSTSTAPVALEFFIGRVYTLTALWNLIGRKNMDSYDGSRCYSPSSQRTMSLVNTELGLQISAQLMSMEHAHTISQTSSGFEQALSNDTPVNSPAYTCTPMRRSISPGTVSGITTPVRKLTVTSDTTASGSGYAISPTVVGSPTIIAVPERAVPRVSRSRPHTSDGGTAIPARIRIAGKKSKRPMTADTAASALAKRSSFGSLEFDPFKGGLSRRDSSVFM